MEPFRDDREAAARRIQELESENDALRNDLFARKAPPPVVREKTGLAPILVALFVGLPVAVLVLGGLVAFLMMPTSSAVQRQLPVEPVRPVAVSPPTTVADPVVIPPPEPPGHWCKKIGQNCQYAPGKLGTCVTKPDCDDTMGSCFICQSQH